MSCDCEEFYFAMGKTALYDAFLQSSLDCGGFPLLNCPNLIDPSLLPQTFTPVANEFLTGYNAGNSSFSAQQPIIENLGDWPDPQGNVGKFLTVTAASGPGQGTYSWATSGLSSNGVPAGGTTGQVLEKKSNQDYDLLWQTPSGGSGGGGTPAAVRAFSSVALTIPNNANTVLSFSGTRFDLNGQWNSANPTRLTVNIAGTYTVFATMDWGAQSGGSGPAQSGTRVLTLRVNGNLTIAVDSNNADVTIGGDTYQTVSTVWTFNAGDYVEILALQSSGAGIVINAGPNWSPEFGMVMEGGIPGPAGAAGQGVPAGGTAAQVLAKIDATDYHTQWVTPAGGGGGGISQITVNAPLSGGVITSTGNIGMQNAPMNCFLGFTGGTGAAQSGTPTFQQLPVPANFQSPSLSPNGTTSSAGVMMGLGSSVQFKPIKSGVVLVLICGFGSNTVAGGYFQAYPYYGTGVPPSNGTAIRGTLFGGGTLGTASSANAAVPFALVWILKLTAGTNYWFDFGVRCNNGQASLQDTSFTFVEL